MQTVIEAREISFEYDGQLVLNKAGLQIRRGDFVGLLGQNGAGKSTLVRLLLGQLAPASGEIRVMGLPPGQARGRIGYVPQTGTGPEIGFPATAKEIVLLGLYGQIGFLHFAKRAHRQKALEALELVDMRAYAGRAIGRMSGGQRQRVLIAKALAGEPALLVLDEPTAGVDEASARQLFALLESLHKKGIAILMISHDKTELAQYASRLLLLENGEIRELPKEGRHGDI